MCAGQSEIIYEKMLRRKPTRLELKIDDTEEFESVKKELEVRIDDLYI